MVTASCTRWFQLLIACSYRVKSVSLTPLLPLRLQMRPIRSRSRRPPPSCRRRVEKEVEGAVQEPAAPKRVRVRKHFFGEDPASEQPPPKRARPIMIKKAQPSLDQLASAVAGEIGKPA